MAPIGCESLARMSDAGKDAMSSLTGAPEVLTTDDGVRIAFRIRGAGERTVTLLHSLSLDGSWFEPLVAAMGPGYRFVVPDLRGHGQSSAGPVSLGRAAADVVAVLDESGVESSIVFGISLGGMVAQAIAANYRERVDALCLVATSYAFDEASAAGTRARAQGARRPGGLEELAAPTVARWFGPADQVPERLAPLAKKAEVEFRAGDGDVHADYLEAMPQVGDFVVPPGLPTLVLGGLEDRSTRRTTIEALAAAIPGASLYFVPGGHLMAFTDPEPVASRLRSFVGGLA